MLEIIQIDIREFEDNIYTKYITLFPENEQRDWDKIMTSYNKGIEVFYKITCNDDTIGFFMIEKLGKDYPYYLDYFGIFKEYQNKGYGTEAIKLLLKEIVQDAGLVIEIEKMVEEEPLTIKRAEFYKRLGFKEVQSEYLLYDVVYTPYLYGKSSILDKEEIDKLMFQYYTANCGEVELKKNCRILK